MQRPLMFLMLCVAFANLVPGCAVPVPTQEEVDKAAALRDAEGVTDVAVDESATDVGKTDAVSDTIGEDSSPTDALAETADADTNDGADDAAETADAEVDTPDATDAQDAQDAQLIDVAVDATDVDTGTDADAAADVDASANADMTADADAADAGPADDADALDAADSDGGTDAVADPCAATDCNDGNACTDDTCDPISGCHNIGNTLKCDDTQPCTVGDHCGGGVCLSGTPTNCDDGNPCTVDACDVVKGCGHVNLPDWTTCGDAKICDAGNCADVKTDKGMAFIAGGTFWMGCNAAKDSACLANESPQHKVTLSPYYIDLTETTVASYKTCVDAGACTVPAQVQPLPGASYPSASQEPVNFVTWDQAHAFCKWRGPSFGLPSEAQWEMAARGSCELNGSSAGDPACAAAMRTFPWGEQPATCAYVSMRSTDVGCGTGSPLPVGSLTAGDSPYGLHDMSGNLAEWTLDFYAPGYFSTSPKTDPQNAAQGPLHMLRGGSFYSTSSAEVRGGWRYAEVPWNPSGISGIRCARAFPVADLCAGVVCTTDGSCGTFAACNPANGQCVTTTSTNCSDGADCTQNDACVGGGCVGTNICDDQNPCTDDTCDLTKGCQFVANAASCDDGNPCTTADACSSKLCKGGPPASCDDGNPCTTDGCDPAKGCSHLPAPSGTACAGGACGGDSLCIAAPPSTAFIPAGTFWMGCNATKDANCNSDENPQHKVTLSAYYMDLTETTVAQYKACVDAGVCTVPSAVQPAQYATYPGATDHPVNFVTWTQAQQFCGWRGADYDLPTEAQWEMAARGSCAKNGSSAGDGGCYAAMRTYSWGEAAATCSYAVMNSTSAGCGANATSAVGSIPAGDSPYGLHDMAGNVWEWTRDWYSSTFYSTSPATDPENDTATPSRVYRGGGWGTIGTNVRSSLRGTAQVTDAEDSIGFRCMKAYTPPPTCDDGNPCTTDSLNADGTCAHSPGIDGSSCQIAGMCEGGACLCVKGTTSTQINDDGRIRTLCVNEFPIWGNRPVNPTGVYTDNKNGTVGDSQTLLMWQQGTSGADVDFATAASYCDNLVLGGKADWRLPTLAELDSTVDYTSSSPATAAFCFNDALHGFWSNTALELVDNPASAATHWSAAIGTNGALFAQSDPQHARCVRGGDGFLPLLQHFDTKTAPSGVAKDNVLGVTWEVYTQGYGTHGSAEPYCNSVQIGGFAGWRMPNIRELTWLDDRSLANPQYDPIAFPNGNGTGFWSSTGVAGTGDYWGIGSNSGGYFHLPDGPTVAIRCVSDALCVGGCDDGNDCTTDSCGSNGCNHTAVGDGANCQIGGLCAAGVCTCTVTTTLTTLNDNGKMRSLCVYEYPAWGNRPVSPTGVYTSNGDGTVSDSQTHLTWQKDQNGADVDLPTARQYCDALVLGGKTDWRMPTLVELDSLTDYARVSPPVDPNFFTSVSKAFWTATAHPVGTDDGPGSVWIIGGEDPTTRSAFWPGTGPAHVRCVRGGQGVAPIPKRFASAYVYQGSTFDNVLQVEWATDYWTYYQPGGAASFCASSNLLGKTGWRLPTIREITWLADRSKAPPLDLTAFGYLNSVDCFSSTPAATDPSKLWFAAFANETGNPGKSYLGYTGYTDAGEAVRCVR